MAAKTTINLTDVIDRSRLSGFQIGVFILCAICLLMDGFDLQAMAFTAPAVVAHEPKVCWTTFWSSFQFIPPESRPIKPLRYCSPIF